MLGERTDPKGPEKRFGERSERDRAVARHGSSEEQQAIKSAAALLQQARLARARVAPEHPDAAPPFGKTLNPLTQSLDLDLSAHERRTQHPWIVEPAQEPGVGGRGRRPQRVGPPLVGLVGQRLAVIGAGLEQERQRAGLVVAVRREAGRTQVEEGLDIDVDFEVGERSSIRPSRSA